MRQKIDPDLYLRVASSDSGLKWPLKDALPHMSRGAGSVCELMENVLHISHDPLHEQLVMG